MYNGFLGQSLTCDIYAEPETITMGESTTLSWVSANATIAEIDQGIVRCCNKRLYGGLSHTGHDLYMATGDGGTVTISPLRLLIFRHNGNCLTQTPGACIVEIKRRQFNIS